MTKLSIFRLRVVTFSEQLVSCSLLTGLLASSCAYATNDSWWHCLGHFQEQPRIAPEFVAVELFMSHFKDAEAQARTQAEWLTAIDESFSYARYDMTVIPGVDFVRISENFTRIGGKFNPANKKFPSAAKWTQSLSFTVSVFETIAKHREDASLSGPQAALIAKNMETLFAALIKKYPGPVEAKTLERLLRVINIMRATY